MTAPLTMYSTTWCGACVRLKRTLERAGVEFVEVDIENDEAAADHVMRVNNGMRTVPTVVLPDGSTLTNPTAAEVIERLPASA